MNGKDLDARSDIYSLGVTFYQMLTGLNPYFDLNTEYEIYNKITKEDLPDPRTIYPGVSDKMVGILQKALAKNPEDRFQSCDEFIQVLEGEKVAPPPKKPITLEPTIGSSDEKSNSFYISLFLALGSLISLINSDFFYISILFGIINILMYMNMKDEHKSFVHSIIVYGSLAISVMVSILYLF